LYLLCGQAAVITVLLVVTLFGLSLLELTAFNKLTYETSKLIALAFGHNAGLSQQQQQLGFFLLFS